ncbi:MAG: tetratricopeptide repeat protein [Bacteroidales bacterium]|jgi:tetratricopeptide (TPR) repeat protein|nr:tetratricopeptide repeat protein [Bacteroidales bacterium]
MLKEDREQKVLMDKFKKSIKEDKVTYFDSVELEMIIEGFLEIEDFDYLEKALHKAITLFPKHEYFRILSIKFHLINMNIHQAKAELAEYEWDFGPSVEFYKEKVICAKMEGEAKSGETNRISLLNKALKLDNSDAETHFMLVSEYLSVADVNNAVDHAVRVMELDPETRFQVQEYSLLCEQTEQYEVALRFFKQMVDRFPLSKDCWQGYALALAWNEQYDEALDANEYVLSIDPDTPDAYFNKGKIYFDRQDFPAAINALLHAYDLDKTDSNVLLNIACCYELMELPDKAVEYYNRVKLLYPANVKANLGIINQLCEEGKFNEARTFMEHQLHSGDVAPELIFRAVDVLLDENMPMPEDEDNEEHVEEMDIEREEENYEMIGDYLKIALYSSNDRERFLSQFAQFCCYSGRSRIGTKLFEALMTDDKLNTFQNPLWNYVYAGLLLTSGLLDQGLHYLEQALCAEPHEIGLLISINHELLHIEEVRALIERYVS